MYLKSLANKKDFRRYSSPIYIVYSSHPHPLQALHSLFKKPPPPPPDKSCTAPNVFFVKSFAQTP